MKVIQDNTYGKIYCSLNGKNYVIKIAILLEAIQSLSKYKRRFSKSFKKVLKFIYKHKQFQNLENNLKKKNRAGVNHTPDFARLCCKATIKKKKKSIHWLRNRSKTTHN